MLLSEIYTPSRKGKFNLDWTEKEMRIAFSIIKSHGEMDEQSMVKAAKMIKNSSDNPDRQPSSIMYLLEMIHQLVYGYTPATVTQGQNFGPTPQVVKFVKDKLSADGEMDDIDTLMRSFSTKHPSDVKKVNPEKMNRRLQSVK